MNAPRLSLMERLRIGQAALALAEEKKKAQPPAVIVPDYTPPEPAPKEDRSAEIAAAKLRETFPLHACGVRMSLCACGEFVCRAPGHPLHVCKAPEFSQVVEPNPNPRGDP